MTGFFRWCAFDDQDKKIIGSHFIDDALKERMERIPCHNDFYRLVQWHNLAFAMTRAMNIPTLVMVRS